MKKDSIQVWRTEQEEMTVASASYANSVSFQIPDLLAGATVYGVNVFYGLKLPTSQTGRQFDYISVCSNIFSNTLITQYPIGNHLYQSAIFKYTGWLIEANVSDWKLNVEVRLQNPAGVDVVYVVGADVYFRQGSAGFIVPPQLISNEL